MTEDARKRIQALEQFSELSGFNIAMKDLRFVVQVIC
jgi:transcription-repair coupling factor (superfamily II helicase)